MDSNFSLCYNKNAILYASFDHYIKQMNNPLSFIQLYHLVLPPDTSI